MMKREPLVITNRMRHVAIALLIVAALIASIFGAYKLMGQPAEQPTPHAN